MANVAAVVRALSIALCGALVGCGAKTEIDRAIDTHSAPPDVGVDPGEPPTTIVIDVPYDAPTTPSRGIFGTNVRLSQVDVAIVIDTTASMDVAIFDLKSSIETEMLPALHAVIESVGLAVINHKDYPLPPFGGTGDFPVRIEQVVTTDAPKVVQAIGFLSADGGGDNPESQIPAMEYALTGGALQWLGASLEAHRPARGTWGGVDFRAGSLPVVALVTDIDWHDERNAPYSDRVHAPPSLLELERAFRASSAKFVDVTDGMAAASEWQADELSDASGSHVDPSAFGAACGDGACCTGMHATARPPAADGSCRLNFLHAGGGGVGSAITSAVHAITLGTNLDVVVIASNDPGNPPGVDATGFIRALRAVDEGDAAHACSAHAARDADGDGVLDTFTAVRVGTRVCFEVLPRVNSAVHETSVDQHFDAILDVVGLPGPVRIERRMLRFVVPAASR